VTRSPRIGTGSPGEVALVTYRTRRGVPQEDRILAEALRRNGGSVAHPVWDDPNVDWTRFGVTVVRSTWDYYRRRPAFLHWMGRVGRITDLWNRPAVLRWNTDKRYLRALGRAGVPVVPTVWIPTGRPVDLAKTMDRRGWSAAVVKPAVSAAGERTYRVARAEASRAQRHLDGIGRTGVALVQPYLPSATRGGERSLVFLDGRYSHCVRRVPLFDRAPDQGPETLASATAEMRRVAASALAACPGDLLYARVDLIADAEGSWHVLEVELTEPSLFFVPYPKGAETLAAAILRRLRR
jgi:glutathione synthase/RimK-type ligase-like ATP-grasp enzyme